MTSEDNMLDEQPWVCLSFAQSNPYLQFYELPELDVFPSSLSRRDYSPEIHFPDTPIKVSNLTPSGLRNRITSFEEDSVVRRT